MDPLMQASLIAGGAIVAFGIGAWVFTRVLKL